MFSNNQLATVAMGNINFRVAENFCKVLMNHYKILEKGIAHYKIQNGIVKHLSVFPVKYSQLYILEKQSSKISLLRYFAIQWHSERCSVYGQVLYINKVATLYRTFAIVRYVLYDLLVVSYTAVTMLLHINICTSICHGFQTYGACQHHMISGKLQHAVDMSHCNYIDYLCFASQFDQLYCVKYQVFLQLHTADAYSLQLRQPQ